MGAQGLRPVILPREAQRALTAPWGLRVPFSASLTASRQAPTQEHLLIRPLRSPQTSRPSWEPGLVGWEYRQAGGLHQGQYLVGTAALPEAGGVPWRHLRAAAGARG